LGGANDAGTVYELTPSGGNWIESVIYSFSGDYGPYVGLTMDAAGNLYGTTRFGGVYQHGTVFKLSRSGGAWTYTELHAFGGDDDGGDPLDGVTLDANGNLYGTASNGGAYGLGVVFEITP
jgi:uncharacterized repeat protein (TIGR03803 family)